MNYLAEHVPTLVRDGKIVCYSDVFREKLGKKLEEFYNLFSPLTDEPAHMKISGDWVIPYEVENYYYDATELISKILFMYLSHKMI